MATTQITECFHKHDHIYLTDNIKDNILDRKDRSITSRFIHLAKPGGKPFRTIARDRTTAERLYHPSQIKFIDPTNPNEIISLQDYLLRDINIENSRQWADELVVVEKQYALFNEADFASSSSCIEAELISKFSTTNQSLPIEDIYYTLIATKESSGIIVDDGKKPFGVFTNDITKYNTRQIKKIQIFPDVLFGGALAAQTPCYIADEPIIFGINNEREFSRQQELMIIDFPVNDADDYGRDVPDCGWDRIKERNPSYMQSDGGAASPAKVISGNRIREVPTIFSDKLVKRNSNKIIVTFIRPIIVTKNIKLEFLERMLKTISQDNRLNLEYHLSEDAIQRRCKTFTTSKWPGIPSCGNYAMAFAGWRFIGTTSDWTQCDICKIRVHKWLEDDNPIFEHKKHSPSCALIKEIITLVGEPVLKEPIFRIF
uniref:Inhibition of apoptosis protein IAP-3 homolog protein n=1 Tax=Abalone asfa-like virus TaxID=2839893 RepID=A0A5K7Y332_9VIRU|nr:inhibition of apoptosis protein IAP-3 homolog protein [Abalone asfa-like virus]BCY04530.1 hypothetical protein [Abalone asfa-like virus]